MDEFEQEFKQKAMSGFPSFSSKEQENSLHEWTEELQKKAQVEETETMGMGEDMGTASPRSIAVS